MFVYVYVMVYTCIYMNMYIYICVKDIGVANVYIYICIHICTHVHIQAYDPTYPPQLKSCLVLTQGLRGCSVVLPPWLYVLFPLQGSFKGDIEYMVYGIWYRICGIELGVHYGCFHKLGLLSKGGLRAPSTGFRMDVRQVWS